MKSASVIASQAAGPGGEDVAPERLLCPRCRYSVFGLSVPRCPECGAEFTWDEVRTLALGADTDLFEHRMLRQPVRSLLRTWYRAAFWPERIWARLTPFNRPAPGALLLFAFAQVVVFVYGWRAMAAVVDPVMNGTARWVSGLGGPSLWSFVYHLRVPREFFGDIGTWYVCSFGVMLLFFDPKACPGSRWLHILRVHVYVTAFAALFPAIWCILEACIDFTYFFQAIPVAAGARRTMVSPRAYLYLGNGMQVVALVVTWMHLRLACRRYLRLPYSAAIAALVMISGSVLSDLVQTLLLMR